MTNNAEQTPQKANRKLKKLFLDLGASLLNATLLLLIVLCTLISLIFYQIDRLSDGLAKLEQFPAKIVASLEEDTFIHELERFRNNMAILNDQLESEEPVISPESLQAISMQLTTLEQSLQNGVNQCAVKIREVVTTAVQSLGDTVR